MQRHFVKHRQFIAGSVLGLALIICSAASAIAQSVPEILSVQERLAELGYDPGPADGLIGSQTREAISHFQADMGLGQTGQITVPLLNVLGANPNARQPIEDVQARLVDIIGARWEEQAAAPAETTWQPPDAAQHPRFAEYPISESTDPLVERVDFTSHPDAELFSETLRECVGKPADFAGRYRIVQVGCGTTCQAVIAVDATNGQVLIGPTAEFGFAYDLTSRLLIANPTEIVVAAYDTGIPVWAATRWYVFDGFEFQELTVVDEDDPDAATVTPDGEFVAE